jgi:hypothetical protein
MGGAPLDGESWRDPSADPEADRERRERGWGQYGILLCAEV